MKIKELTYYDELNDEFADDNIETITIDKNYCYYKDSKLYKLSCFFWYRIIALPLAFLYMKIKFRHKVVGKNKLKIKEGAFLFGNHTHNIADAVVPTLVCLKKKVYVIVHPNNVSIKGMKNITPKLGAIPLPDDYDATKNFQKCIKKRFEEKQIIHIYPEAHIWPYYTSIRPFTSSSFRYPVTMNSKCYCITNTYQKRKFSKHPKMITYVDGPFYPDETLSKKDAQEKLRNEVYETMKQRSMMSNVEYIKYIKGENKND